MFNLNFGTIRDQLVFIIFIVSGTEKIFVTSVTSRMSLFLALKICRSTSPVKPNFQIQRGACVE
jgi:hypothetical protein